MMQEIPDLLDGLRRAPKILSGFVEKIPESKLDIRRGVGFWTIAEHVSHLAQVQPMLFDRLDRFMNEDHPEFIPYIPGEDEKEPDTPERMSIASALMQFTQYRYKQLVLLENVSDATWEKTAEHSEYEQYSLYILARHILMHDHWHMYRMEELWLTKNEYLTKLN